MSITTDLKSYADSAVNQGKQNVQDLAGKATGAVSELRVTAEKAINLDALKTAIEPYLAQVKEYGNTVTDKAEELFSGLKNDKRIGKVVEAAEPVFGAVVGTVQTRVVEPVLALTGRGARTVSKPVRKASPAKASKPAATRPAAPKSTSSTTTSTSRPATRTTARKAPVKRTPKA